MVSERHKTSTRKTSTTMRGQNRRVILANIEKKIEIENEMEVDYG